MTVYNVFYFNVFAVKNPGFGYNIAVNSANLAAKLLFISFSELAAKSEFFNGEIVIQV